MLVTTRGVNEEIATSARFAAHVAQSVVRFKRGDWGEMDKEDIAANDRAIKNDERVLAGYGSDDARIWIILEADRSHTTILFPNEY